MGGLTKNINRWITEEELERAQTYDKENIHIRIWEIQIKTTRKRHCTTLSWTKILNT